MKKFLLIGGAVVASVSFFACSSGSGSGNDSLAEQAKNKIVCVWDKVPLRQKPEKEGKWLSALNLGETMDYQDKTVDAADKDRIYYKVKLSDGSEGWAPDYGLVANAVPGAITEECKLYKRPDMLTATTSEFHVAELVAVTQEKDGWSEVVGVKKHLKGWIQTSNISLNQVDISFAALAQKEVFNDKGEIAIDKLPEFLKNVPVQSSQLFSKLTALTTNDQTSEPENTEADTSAYDEESDSE